jgi:hypothetical protein
MATPALIRSRRRGFTLLEVALIVAIIGMMLLMIVGYLMAPKKTGPLPPLEASKGPKIIRGPSTTEPAETPAASVTPAKTIELTPSAVPTFR